MVIGQNHITTANIRRATGTQVQRDIIGLKAIGKAIKSLIPGHWDED